METLSKRVKFPISEEPIRMGRVSNGAFYDNIFMAKLDSKNEELLNKNGFIRYLDKIIEQKDLIVTGDLDFNNPAEIEAFRNCNFAWCDIMPGSFIPFNFNYDTLEADAISIGCNHWIIRTIETFDPLLMFKVAYARLGKPKKIVVFKLQTHKKPSELC